MGDAFAQTFRDLKQAVASTQFKSITLMAGVPGAGKSTFVEKNNDPSVLYLDTVGARPGFRQSVINIARKAGLPVDIVFVDTPFETCVARNSLRSEGRKVPYEALERAAAHLKAYPPTKAEGFRHVTVIGKQMPLSRSCSVEAFRSNIATEVEAGKSRNQAVAIAADTLREACAEASKPLPAGTVKALEEELDGLPKVEKRGPRTREYLEAALDRARKVLSPRDFALIFQAARASAGGKIAARNRRDRLTALERAYVDKALPRGMSDAELNATLHKLNRTMAARKRKGDNVDPLLAAAKPYVAEMKRRGLKVAGGATKAPTKKGFSTGEPEGGMHAHGLDRKVGRTLNDGDHLHIFVMPGTDEILITEEDGAHSHEIDGDGTKLDGAHTHRLHLPDGRPIETMPGGPHTHALMMETSGFDGLHKHTLKLPDGQAIKSLSPAEFIDRFNIEALGHPIHSSRMIAEALLPPPLPENDTPAEARLIPIELVQRMVAEGGEVMQVAEIHAEVLESGDGVLTLVLDGGEPFDLVGEGEPGDMVTILATAKSMAVMGFSKHAEPTSADRVKEWGTWLELVSKQATQVPWTGWDGAAVMFVCGSPSELEVARGEALVGMDAATFKEHYLDLLGLKRADVSVGFAIPVVGSDPVPWRAQLVKEMQRHPRARVVALGKVARDALQGVDFLTLPHPAVLRRRGNRGEVARKIMRLKKALDNIPAKPDHGGQTREDAEAKRQLESNPAEDISGMRKEADFRVQVIKSDDELQIVSGAVLDPYQVDLQEDWVPVAEIEATSYDFMESSRTIGFRHVQEAEGAVLVESFVEAYPPGQRELAMKNQPHSVWRRAYGADIIHSGAWIVSVRLPDDLWAMHKNGELNAFSIGGFSFKTAVTTDAMPEVEFIDLKPRA